jgi:hypothetical protein
MLNVPTSPPARSTTIDCASSWSNRPMPADHHDQLAKCGHHSGAGGLPGSGSGDHTDHRRVSHRIGAMEGARPMNAVEALAEGSLATAEPPRSARERCFSE